MRQYNVMRGSDKQNRSFMIKFPRVKTGATEESYILTQLYMAERSTAATEFCSLGTQERSLAIYDYNGFDSANAPPFQMQLNAATVLQKTYPERLGMVVMVEPPFWLRGLFNMIAPFLSTSITDRIKWVSGVVSTIFVLRVLAKSRKIDRLTIHHDPFFYPHSKKRRPCSGL